jgi:hypothetical protein
VSSFVALLILQPWNNLTSLTGIRETPIRGVRKIFIVPEQIPSFLSFLLSYPSSHRLHSLLQLFTSVFIFILIFLLREEIGRV